MTGMTNDAGEKVDMFIPRKCSSSSRIISAKDHASIQLDFAKVSAPFHSPPLLP